MLAAIEQIEPVDLQLSRRDGHVVISQPLLRLFDLFPDGSSDPGDTAPSTLKEFCEAQLRSKATTVDEDERALMTAGDDDSGESMARWQRNCVVVRLEEKRLLQEAIVVLAARAASVHKRRRDNAN